WEAVRGRAGGSRVSVPPLARRVPGCSPPAGPGRLPCTHPGARTPRRTVPSRAPRDGHTWDAEPAVPRSATFRLTGAGRAGPATGRASGEHGRAGYAPGDRTRATGAPGRWCGHRNAMVCAATRRPAGSTPGATATPGPSLAAARGATVARASAAAASRAAAASAPSPAPPGLAASGTPTAGAAANPAATCPAATRPAGGIAGPATTGTGVCSALGYRRTTPGDRTDPHRTQSGRPVHPRGTDHGRIPFDLQDAHAAQPDRGGGRGDRSTLHERLRRRP